MFKPKKYYSRKYCLKNFRYWSRTDSTYSTSKEISETKVCPKIRCSKNVLTCHILGNWTESWNFRPKGDGRSGPSGPQLPDKILNLFNMLDIEKDRLFWHIVILYLENCAIIMLPNFVLRKLCYYYAPFRSHRKWLCYFVPYRHGKLDLGFFFHGRAEKCIGNGAHIVGRNRWGK